MNARLTWLMSADAPPALEGIRLDGVDALHDRVIGASTSVLNVHAAGTTQYAIRGLQRSCVASGLKNASFLSLIAEIAAKPNMTALDGLSTASATAAGRAYTSLSIEVVADSGGCQEATDLATWLSSVIDRTRRPERQKTACANAAASAASPTAPRQRVYSVTKDVAPHQ